jgi:hypothetical protein
MAFQDYETVLSNVKIFSCILLTTKEEYKDSTDLRWACSCGQEISSSYRRLTQWKGKCESCREKNKKKQSRKFYTYEVIKAVYEEAGCQLLSPPEEYTGARDKVRWRCKCGDEQESSFSSFKTYMRCRRCGIREAKGDTYEAFREALENEGWKLLDPKIKYKNNKTIMQVLTNTGHLTETSYNRFQQGHRAKKDVDDFHRKKYEEVKKAFEEKEFELLETEYVNKSTLMKYRCRCGSIAEITYENLTKNIIGCQNCHYQKITGDQLTRWEKESTFQLKASAGKNMKKYVFPSGREVKVRGYENFCLDDLLSEGINENDITVDPEEIPVIQYLWEGHYHSYYPDIFIANENRIIEVKSPLTINYLVEKNQKKWEAAAMEGYNFEVRVYNKKNLLEKRLYSPRSVDPVIKKMDTPKPGKTLRLEEEQEKPIKNWPGCRVTKDGRVIGNHGREYVKKESEGHVKVQLSRKIDGEITRKRKAIDYLVLKHFLPEDQIGKLKDTRYEITHKDGNIHNNNYSNLKLALKEQCRKDAKHVKDCVGEGVIQMEKDGTFIREFKDTKEASAKTGISEDNIKKACRGKRPSAGGFTWEYRELVQKQREDVKKWRKIEEFPQYRISRSGSIWSENVQDYLHPYEDNGYQKVKLRKDGKRYTRAVHILVAETYLTRPKDPEATIRHRNMNKKDNSIGNLAWE